MNEPNAGEWAERKRDSRMLLYNLYWWSCQMRALNLELTILPKDGLNLEYVNLYWMNAVNESELLVRFFEMNLGLRIWCGPLGRLWHTTEYKFIVVCKYNNLNTDVIIEGMYNTRKKANNRMQV